MLLDVIGEGGFAVVYKATSKSGEVVAIKRVSKLLHMFVCVHEHAAAFHSKHFEENNIVVAPNLRTFVQILICTYTQFEFLDKFIPCFPSLPSSIHFISNKPYPQ